MCDFPMIMKIIITNKQVKTCSTMLRCKTKLHTCNDRANRWPVIAQLLVSNVFMTETIICSHNSFMSRRVINMTLYALQRVSVRFSINTRKVLFFTFWGVVSGRLLESRSDVQCKYYFKNKVCSPKASLPWCVKSYY